MLGRLDNSSDVSGLANRGTYQKIPGIGILPPEVSILNSDGGGGR